MTRAALMALLGAVLLLVSCCGAAPSVDPEIMANQPIVDVYIETGQSVMAGIGGDAGPYVTCPYWNVPATGYIALSSSVTSRDCVMARALVAAGRTIAIINLSQGGTSSLDWTPPSGSAWAIFAPKFASALAALPAQFPAGTVFRYWHMHDQGESDVGTNLTQVNNWANVFEQIHAAIEAMVGVHIPRVIGFTKDPQPVNTYITQLNAQQLIAAGDAAHAYHRETSTGVTYQVDNIHPDLAGYAVLGGIQANTLLGLDIMGSLSTYAKNKAIDHVRNKAAYSPAATHYLHLYSAGSTPISGNGYVVQSKTNNTTTWPAASSRIKANGTAWTFPTPTGTWPDVVEWRLTDSATEGAGNILASDTFSPVPVSVATGPLSFAVGAITITAAVGGFVTSVVHGLLDLICGGTAYTQLATTYGSYWAGDPQGAGSQVGSRVAITQASTWAAASGGSAVTSADITLAQQVTGTYWAEHDASSGGNLLFSAPRPAATGAGGTIQAGQLQTTIS